MGGCIGSGALLVFGGGLEREHKSNKRRQVVSPSRGGLWGWDSLSPMTQHTFTMNVARPRIAAADGMEPHPERLARLAPITWGDLGIPFNMAFIARGERQQNETQCGIKSDLDAHPERDGDNPSNNPCPNCEHMVCVCLGEL